MWKAITILQQLQSFQSRLCLPHCQTTTEASSSSSGLKPTASKEEGDCTHCVCSRAPACREWNSRPSPNDISQISLLHSDNTERCIQKLTDSKFTFKNCFIDSVERKESVIAFYLQGYNFSPSSVFVWGEVSVHKGSTWLLLPGLCLLRVMKKKTHPILLREAIVQDQYDIKGLMNLKSVLRVDIDQSQWKTLKTCIHYTLYRVQNSCTWRWPAFIYPLHYHSIIFKM